MASPEIHWERLKAHELRQLAERDAIVLVPIAALEQHGPHLPVMVDTRLAGEVSARTARLVAAKEPIVVLPTMWHGLSEHHMPFGGTITLDATAFYAVLRSIVRSLVAHGFRRIAIINGHGGNTVASQAAVAELSIEFGIPLIAGTYWDEAAEAFGQILDRQPNVRHACEAETSMMMALEPDLVDASDLAGVKGGLADVASFKHTVDTSSYRWESFASRTHNGVIGDPTTATPEKGVKLLDAAAEALARLVLNPGTWAVAVDRRPTEIAGVAVRSGHRI